MFHIDFWLFDFDGDDGHGGDLELDAVVGHLEVLEFSGSDDGLLAEVVVVADLLGGEDTGGDVALPDLSEVVPGENDFLVVLEVDVGDVDVDDVTLAGSGGAERRDGALVAVGNLGGAVVERDELRILVDLVHLEDVVGRSEDHLVVAGEDHRLEDVDHLGDVGHLDAAGVLVEDVQGHGGDDGVAHGGLLEEVAGIGAGFDIPPGAPLVHEKVDLALGIILVHDGDMLLDAGLDGDCTAECAVVLLVGEIGGGALAAGPGHAGVVMHGDGVHLVADVLHADLGPVVIGVGCAAGDLIEAVAVVVAGVGGIAAEEVGIVLRGHVAAAAPSFVADAEELDFPGLVAAVAAAHLGHGAVAGGSHILHPLCKLFGSAAADVAADVGLAAEQLAEVQELVRTEAVVLEGAAPVVVADFGALGDGTDAVHPVIVVGEAAAGPAHDGNLKLLEGVQDVEAVAVLIGDGGVLSYPQAAIDAAAEVLRKLSVNLLGNDLSIGLCVLDMDLGLGRQADAGGKDKCQRDEESVIFHIVGISSFYVHIFTNIIFFLLSP